MVLASKTEASGRSLGQSPLTKLGFQSMKEIAQSQLISLLKSLEQSVRSLHDSSASNVQHNLEQKKIISSLHEDK